MYFRESDTIANENIDLIEVIQRLDEHLFLNQSGYVRLRDTASHVDCDVDVVGNLLDHFAKNEVVIASRVAICPKDDIPIEEEGDRICCDLCDHTYSRSDLRSELIFYPRSTQFECGDEFSRKYESSCDVDGLFRIIGCGEGNRSADVIFVHGLDGNARDTWHPVGQPQSYWPKWLGEEVPNIGVWSLEYEAHSLAWSGTAMPLEDRAGNILDRFNLAGLGRRPIIFICHSLGGLLVKQCLHHAKTMGNTDWSILSEATRAIMFLATPHTGSSISTFVQHLGVLLRPNVSVEDLERHHPHLRVLNTWYANHAPKMGIQTRVYFEKKKTRGLMVVDESSANPGITGVFPVALDTDHVEICKPNTKRSQVFARAVQMVTEIVKQTCDDS